MMQWHSGWRPFAALPFSLLVTFFVTVFALGARAEVVTLDKVVAVVDDDVVMASELNQQLQRIERQLREQNTPMPPREELREQVLEHLIVERLQLQIARRVGVTIPDSEVAAALTEIAANNNMSVPEFQQALAKDGVPIAQLRDNLRKDLLIARVQQGSVNRRIKISEQEVDNFLNSTEGQFWTSPDYRLGHILIGVPSGATPDQVAAAKAKAEDLRQQLAAGANFKELAIRHSSGNNALEGGDIGWRKRAQLPTLFADAIKPLNPGDITAPLKSGAGFHLLKIYDMRGAGSEQLVQQTQVRHILLKTNALRDDAKAQAQLADIRARIVSGDASFAEMAKEYSEDIGSALRGGDLGWTLPGQLVPAFEQTMDATAINAISRPFKSEFGWHILQVLDRRQEDLSEEVIRNQAKQLLRKRKFEEELPVWLQEIRDEAFVDIRL